MSSDVKAGGGEPRRFRLDRIGNDPRIGVTGAYVGPDSSVVVVPEVDFDAVVRERDEARAEAGGLEIVATRRLHENRELRERVRVLAAALAAASPWVGYEGDVPEVKAQVSAALASVADSDPEGAAPRCGGPACDGGCCKRVPPGGETPGHAERVKRAAERRAGVLDALASNDGGVTPEVERAMRDMTWAADGYRMEGGKRVERPGVTPEAERNARVLEELSFMRDDCSRGVTPEGRGGEELECDICERRKYPTKAWAESVVCNQLRGLAAAAESSARAIERASASASGGEGKAPAVSSNGGTNA